MSPISSDPKGSQADPSSPNPSQTADANSAVATTNRLEVANTQSSQQQQQEQQEQPKTTVPNVNNLIADTYRDLAKGEEYANMIEQKLSQFDEKVKVFYESLGMEWNPDEMLVSDEEEEDEEEPTDAEAANGVIEKNGNAARRKPKDEEKLAQTGPTEEEVKILEQMDAFMMGAVRPGGGDGDAKGKGKA